MKPEVVSKDDLESDVEKVYGKLDSNTFLTKNKYRELGEYDVQHLGIYQTDRWSQVLQNMDVEFNTYPKSRDEDLSVDDVQNLIVQAAQECRGNVTVNYLKRVIPVPYTYVLNICGASGVNDLKDMFDIEQYEVNPCKYWIDELEGEVGRFEPEEIKQMVEDASHNHFSTSKHLKEIAEYSDNYEGVDITVSNSGLNGVKMFVRTEGVDPFEKYRQELPYRYFTQEWFDALVSRGVSPSAACALIDYLMMVDNGEGESLSQEEAADKNDVTALTLRNTADKLVDEFGEGVTALRSFVDCSGR
jgi:hypothetical protein